MMPGMTVRYIGSGPYCYANSLAMVLGSAAPSPAVIEVLTGSPRRRGRSCLGSWPLRTWLEHQHIAHVLAVACDHRIPAGAGHIVRADELAARLPKRATASGKQPKTREQNNLWLEY